MLRIAICDDISTELRHVVGLTNEYLAARNLIADIREFPSRRATYGLRDRNLSHIFARHDHANDQRA